MVFTSPTFLFLFLPAVLLGSFVIPSRWRNGWLLLSSLIFYFWGSGVLVLLLVVSTITDFSLGRVVARASEQGNERRKRAAISGSVLVNLGLLGYFKYANFLVEQLNSVGRDLGIGEIAWTSVTLPIGISFYTFQTMSYTLDLARGRATPLDRIVDFGLYVSFFPQLVAGPIVRYHEISEQIVERRVAMDGFSAGAGRFMVGLSKKVIVADQVAVIADRAFAVDAVALTSTDAWLGILAYTIQIYFDFSGYSDMAIGLGQMFGFTFPENFRRPYSAVSITDFWRRWHITLSNWFRDYLFIPLGGSRVEPRRVYANLMAVFVITGLWHGANWTFVVWGLFHGVLLLAERVLDQRWVEGDAPSFVPIRRAGTFFLVVIGWVFFRATDIGHAFSYLRAMFGGVRAEQAADPLLTVGNTPLVVLALALLTLGVSGRWVTGPRAVEMLERGAPPLRVASALALVTAFSYALILVISGTFSPFLYFQF